MDIQTGETAVKTARKAIDLWVREGKRLHPEGLPEFFEQELGVFVTIHTYPERKLRGCIGFVEPNFPLSRGLVEAGIYATQDPRFPRLRKEELDRVVVEVSVLTKPEPIEVRNPEELPERIRIGRDGLIARMGFYNGLLLPQVATEHGMNEEDFLSHVCMKAGLPPDEWRKGRVKIYRFQAEVFSEERPYGRVYKIENTNIE